MKNISFFYGGAISTNDEEFKNFMKRNTKIKFFSKDSILKQILIFLV